ncbi:zinc ion binding nucleic acid binding [Euphorbia peplus]|nr:zinc ion binding nucleic acid binding [Euphorbia peplus]
MDIMDIGYGFHLVRFDRASDRSRVVEGGPWTVQGHYLTVRTWTSDFRAAAATINSTLVWVRFPDLPVQMYNEDFLKMIAGSFGKAVKVDLNTLKASRGKFARVCVEIDLAKPLIAEFEVNDVSYHIEYEGLHTACTNCGKYGHLRNACASPSLIPVKVSEVVNGATNCVSTEQQPEPVDGATSLSGASKAFDEDEGYGPWRTKIKKPVYKGPKQGMGAMGGGNHSRPFAHQGDSNFSKGDKGMSFNAGSSKRHIGDKPEKSSLKFVSKAPSHFKDLAGHNVFGDLQDDVSDPIDYEAVANILSRGKRSRADLTKSVNSSKPPDKVMMARGSKHSEFNSRTVLGDMTNVDNGNVVSKETRDLIKEVAHALAGSTTTPMS